MRPFLVPFTVLALAGLAAPAQAQLVFYSDYYTPRTVYRSSSTTRYVETVPATRYVEYVPTTRVVYEPAVTRVVREVETVPTRTVVLREVETPRYVITVPETTRVVRTVPVETVRVAEPTYVVRSRTVVRPAWRHR
jgi:hypothetical protein